MRNWRSCNNRKMRDQRARRHDNYMRAIMPGLFRRMSLRIIIDRFADSAASGRAAAEALARLGGWKAEPE